jgi:hypothetical protein
LATTCRLICAIFGSNGMCSYSKLQSNCTL